MFEFMFDMITIFSVNMTITYYRLLFRFLFLGFPPIIYLSLNKTIRTDCINMLLRLFGIDRVQMLSAKARFMFPSAANRARVGPTGIGDFKSQMVTNTLNTGPTIESINGGDDRKITPPAAGDGHNEIDEL